MFADERDAVQKKTFTKWVNKHLAKVCCLLVSLCCGDDLSVRPTMNRFSREK